MKRSKGFTLIELLAVIVILAIIALIATPTILGVIEKSKKGAAESSAYGYIDAVEKEVVLKQLDQETLEDGVYSISELDIKVKGQNPTEGWIQLEGGQVVDYSLKITDYAVNMKDKKAQASKGEAIKDQPTGNYKKYNVGDAVTIDGIGYHVIKTSNTTNEYVSLLRDESIGQIPFDENGGTDFETSTLKTYLNTTYKDTFGDKKDSIKEITLLDFGIVSNDDDIPNQDFENAKEGTYLYLYKNYGSLFFGDLHQMASVEFYRNGFMYTLGLEDRVYIKIGIRKINDIESNTEKFYVDFGFPNCNHEISTYSTACSILNVRPVIVINKSAIQ